ncbi:O-antigen ligase family protein [Thalassotalea psychrophila]|uniref:O-antigen ligase family protein n=1 Tax=Thalassotalea psychrophila TaxID=3065647 RepID=A0ABY9TUQ2_9GAMM|nr:O-antigen ligase family protein [Colwelliaceae bacterium SQ149]
MLNIILFITTYVSGFILTFFRLPVFAFVLYETVYFYYPQNRWWGVSIPDISYSFFAVLLMVFALLIKLPEHIKNKLFSAPQFKWVYLLLFIYGITYFWATSQNIHFDAFVYFLKLVIIISIAYKLIDTDEKLNLVLYGYIFGAWYISFLAWQLGRNSGIRLEGIGTVDSPDANGIAAAIAPAIVISLYYFWVTKQLWLKALFAVSGVFIANSLILINSRGAFLAVLLSVCFFMAHMFFSKYKRELQKRTAITLTILGILGSLYLADNLFIERISTIKEARIDQEKESGSTRLIFWHAALKLSIDHPMGLGYKGFNLYSPLYIDESIETGKNKYRSVHSSWLEALTEAGYIGFAVFITMIYSSFKTLKVCKQYLSEKRQLDKYYKVIAIEAAFIAFLIAMTFLNRMRSEILYWCILYSACAYNIYILRGKDNDEKS